MTWFLMSSGCSQRAVLHLWPMLLCCCDHQGQAHLIIYWKLHFIGAKYHTIWRSWHMLQYRQAEWECGCALDVSDHSVHAPLCMYHGIIFPCHCLAAQNDMMKWFKNWVGLLPPWVLLVYLGTLQAANCDRLIPWVTWPSDITNDTPAHKSTHHIHCRYGQV
jgi:hypothetical protein